MGFVGLPVSLFLYWVVLRPKKEAPFPKGGLIALFVAGAVCIAVSSVLSVPISALVVLLRSGAITDPVGFFQTISANHDALKEMLASTQDNYVARFFWSLFDMFLGAGLLEEGLKYVTCRIACKREGMIRTWMDSVIAFAFVGITFEFIENVAFGMNYDLMNAILRSLAPAHFQFGIIMGYFFGKYLVTGNKKYRTLSLWVPVLIHTCCNTLVQVPYVSYGIVASYFITACVAVYYLLQWQRSKMLDIPVALSAAAPTSAASGVAAQASVGAAARYRASSQPKHAQASPTLNGLDEHEFTTYPRRFNGYSWFKPLLVGLIYGALSIVFMLAVTALTRLLFGTGTVNTSTGYDGMDFYTAAGAFENGATAAIAVPSILIAALIVRDRPISSYFSSMGGWRWKAFFKSLAVAIVVLGIPIAVSLLMKGKTDVRFTLPGFILLTLFVPFQSLGEELTFRSYIAQTAGSWFKLPLVGILVQIVLFTVVHPYNVIGIVDIVLSALLYMLCCLVTKGIEAPTALHIVNNMTEIWMTGFGFGVITSETTVASVVINITFKTLFLLFLIFADKKLHWFDDVQRDDVALWNAKHNA